MNPLNKKPPGARGIPQPFTLRNGRVHQFKPPVAQLKNAVSSQRPVAPPVYRPQPVPRVLQTKKDHLRGGVMRVKAEFKSPVSPSKISKPVVQAKQITPPLTARVLPVRPLEPVAHVPHPTRIPAHLAGGRLAVGYRNTVVQRSLKTRSQAAKEKAEEGGEEKKHKAADADEPGEGYKKAKVYSAGESALSGFKYEAEKKAAWTEDESVKNLGVEGACVATIYYGGQTCAGAYDGGEGYHAEMAALDEFLKKKRSNRSIALISLRRRVRFARLFSTTLGYTRKSGYRWATRKNLAVIRAARYLPMFGLWSARNSPAIG